MVRRSGCRRPGVRRLRAWHVQDVPPPDAAPAEAPAGAATGATPGDPVLAESAPAEAMPAESMPAESAPAESAPADTAGRAAISDEPLDEVTPVDDVTPLDDVTPVDAMLDEATPFDDLALDDEMIDEVPPSDAVPPAVAAADAAIPGRRPSPDAPVRWPDLPAIDDLLAWSGHGVSTGRTWVVSPSQAALRTRWSRLLAASGDDRRRLFVERRGLGKMDTVDEAGLPGYPACGRSIAAESRSGPVPIRYARRSFDRQWLIPDRRVIDRPNVALWGVRTVPGQLFLTSAGPPIAPGGPAITATTLLPQFNHYNGQRGRVWPSVARRRRARTQHPRRAPTAPRRRRSGPRWQVPTSSPIWPGSRPTGRSRTGSPSSSRPARCACPSPPTVSSSPVRSLSATGSSGSRPSATIAVRSPAGPVEPLQRDGDGQPRLAVPIPHLAASRPETVYYTASTGCLEVGDGVITDVDPEVVDYHVGGMPVVEHWLEQRVPFAPRRRQSPLDRITAAGWEAGWTGELLQVLHAITRLVELEPEQGDLLDDVLSGPLLTTRDLRHAGARYARAERSPPRR